MHRHRWRALGGLLGLPALLAVHPPQSCLCSTSDLWSFHMGIALLAAATLTHPLTALHHWWSTRHSPLNRRGPSHCDAQQALRSQLPSAIPANAVRPIGPQGLHESLHHSPVAVRKACKPTARPARSLHHTETRPAVRVLRSHTSSCGRMVIAGRMADVCAELDRLAAIENRH